MNNYYIQNLCVPCKAVFYYCFALTRPLPPISLGPHGIGDLLETSNVGTDNQRRNGGVGVLLSGVPACLVYDVSRIQTRNYCRTYNMSS